MIKAYTETALKQIRPIPDGMYSEIGLPDASVKTDSGRRKKIVAFVEMLERGDTIYPQRQK